MSLLWDWESRGVVDLRKVGAYVYAEDPGTDALLASFMLRFDPLAIDDPAIVAWAEGGGEFDIVLRWRRGEPCPPHVRAYVEAGGEIEAHNSTFERLIWQKIMTPRHGWPQVDIGQFRCSAAAARALGLPARLEKLGEALDLKVKKDKRGEGLIKIHSVPLRIDGNNDPVWHRLAEDPVSMAAFHDYCDVDVLSEAEASSRMVPLGDDEMAIYHLGERINDRGVRIDIASIEAAMKLIDKTKAGLDARMSEVTKGAVTSASQVRRLTAWLIKHGVKVAGLAKADLVEALDLSMTEPCREALSIRQEFAKSSTAKLKAMIDHCSLDGRVRGMFTYHGTGPGRWSSAGGVNLSNLPRPRAVYDNSDLDTGSLFQAFRAAEPQLLRDMYGEELGNPMHLVSDAMRGFLHAAPGHEFVIVDYSGIQGALVTWLANEEWKLEAMRAIIADPSLPDLYRRAAAKILNSTTDVITKKHPMRQAVGKTSELALGFGGGVAALTGMAANYGMRHAALHDLYGPVWTASSEEMQEAAVKRWERCRRSRDQRKADVLTREAWLACALIVAGWRASNPRTAAAWGQLEEAMRDAVDNPGRKFEALDGRVTYLCSRGFLWLRLPSGRCIAYGAPKLRPQAWAKLKLSDGSWGPAETIETEEAQYLERIGQAKIDGEANRKVTAVGWDSSKQKLARYGLYGGLAMENCALGAESDILRRALGRCEDNGYPIVMHCYDEAVAEVPYGQGSVEEMSALMLDLAPWTAGLPLTCHGERTRRYKK